MQSSYLYSIGHGHKTFEELVNELLSFNIGYLVDVRSSPYSKWVPYFNRGMIENLLRPTGIKYGYMGDIIGGRPLNNNCYDEDGFFDYRKMALMPEFKLGLNRLIDANEKHLSVAVMCSESNPAECHRSKLIGRELYFLPDKIEMTHIIAPGRFISQGEIMAELDRGKGDWPFGNVLNQDPIPPFFKSRKSFKKTGTDDNILDYYD